MVICTILYKSHLGLRNHVPFEIASNTEKEPENSYLLYGYNLTPLSKVVAPSNLHSWLRDGTGICERKMKSGKIEKLDANFSGKDHFGFLCCTPPSSSVHIHRR